MLLVLRVAAVAASLLFAGLVVTTLLIVMPGNLEFVPPGTDESGLRFEDGILYIDTSFTIGNQGYHGITDFTFSVKAEVADQLLLTEYNTTPVNIPIGTRQVVPISIPIDLAVILASSYMIFEPANVTFTMGIGGTTTRGLLDFGASFAFEQEFEPLIPEFTFGNVTVSNATGEWVLQVPYTVDTASFLTGNATATVSLLNETGGTLGQTNETIPLGQVWAGNLTFVLSQEQAASLLLGPQDLTLDIALQLPGDLTVTFQETVTFDPGG